MPPRARYSPINHHLTRLLAAAVLLLAAYFKYDQLLSPDLPARRLWHLLHFLFELILGLWLLSNLAPRPAFAVSVLAFASFAVVSLYNAIAGSPSCGCFGRAQVSPWLTLALDTLIVALLILWFPPRRLTSDGHRAGHTYESIVALLALSLTLFTSYRIATYQPGLLHPDGTLTGDPRNVYLAPAAWTGQRFPLTPYLESPPDLSTGRWTLMFVRHNCPLCHDALDRLLSAAANHPDPDLLARILIVEIPPYGPVPWFPPTLRTTRLRDDRAWSLPTPTVVKLDNGQVTTATRGYIDLPTPSGSK